MKAMSNSAGYGATRLTDWGGGFGEMNLEAAWKTNDETRRWYSTQSWTKSCTI